MGDDDGAVVVSPPVEVMRPRAARSVPASNGLPGGVQYSVKLDGLRIVAFARGGGRAVLQSRSGRDRAADFPAIAAGVAALPTGVVLDGELCAWKDGAFAFTELLRSRAARERDGVALSYIAFDVLAVPGRDVREEPLGERWELLTGVLRDAGPPLQQVMATTVRREAEQWEPTLAPLGVEGLVCRGLATRYRPGDPQSRWLKIRRSESYDALLVAVTGPADRPRAALLQLTDGRRVLCSPQLTPVQRHQVGDAITDRVGPARSDPEHGELRPVEPALPAEVEITAGGPHRPVRFVRVRAE
ncbi:DNA ligase [Streptomyces armeniacus]|uniref:DNA ligase n=1 Tax=Streptomyces armeniacus TaxID=83291 RepID=A0A345XPB2_9ACTN|nr:DNA ligase [Streptomyces armeniacus]AXK33478.1 DNA ligase [Streptomyces armeniacus]